MPVDKQGSLMYVQHVILILLFYQRINKAPNRKFQVPNQKKFNQAGLGYWNLVLVLKPLSVGLS